MRPRHRFWVLGALLAAGGCATTPSAPNPILVGRTQRLAVRTDPPGAACTIVQRIDANCWFHPCKPSDAQPCQDPWCQRLREIANADLQTELERIPEVRAQVRIGVGPE